MGGNEPCHETSCFAILSRCEALAWSTSFRARLASPAPVHRDASNHAPLFVRTSAGYDRGARACGLHAQQHGGRLGIPCYPPSAPAPFRKKRGVAGGRRPFPSRDFALVQALDVQPPARLAPMRRQRAPPARHILPASHARKFQCAIASVRRPPRSASGRQNRSILGQDLADFGRIVEAAIAPQPCGYKCAPRACRRSPPSLRLAGRADRECLPCATPNHLR